MNPADLLRRAVDHLAGDGFIAYPTETVWGLGACADRPAAVRRLIDWKGRGEDAPMSVLVDSIDAAFSLECRLDGAAERLAEAFWPGPLTLVVPCAQIFAKGVARGDGALGLRCSPHRVAQTLVAAVADAGLGPLTSTSMNRSGAPPATDRATAEVLAFESHDGGGCPGEPLLIGDASLDADADVDVDVDADTDVDSDADADAGGQPPSSVVDCTGAEPKILRVGAIDRARLESVWSDRPRQSRVEMTR